MASDEILKILMDNEHRIQKLSMRIDELASFVAVNAKEDRAFIVGSTILGTLAVYRFLVLVDYLTKKHKTIPIFQIMKRSYGESWMSKDKLVSDDESSDEEGSDEEGSDEEGSDKEGSDDEGCGGNEGCLCMSSP